MCPLRKKHPIRVLPPWFLWFRSSALLKTSTAQHWGFSWRTRTGAHELHITNGNNIWRHCMYQRAGAGAEVDRIMSYSKNPDFKFAIDIGVFRTYFCGNLWDYVFLQNKQSTKNSLCLSCNWLVRISNPNKSGGDPKSENVKLLLSFIVCSLEHYALIKVGCTVADTMD